MHSIAGDLASILDSDLESGGWNGCLSPYPGITPRQFAMLQLRKSLVKKFHNGETDPIRDNKALDLFLKSNRNCEGFIHDTTTCTSAEAIAFGEAKDFIYRFFYYDDSNGDQLLTLRKISEGFGVGNGSNIGSDATSFYSKVANGKMSASSSDLYDLYLQAISFDPLWARTEALRDQRCGHNIVQENRVSFVPKSTEISRTICTEPVLNMIFQKGIAYCIEKQLRRVVGIDLAKQPDKNRRLCRLGSETGKFGTIDLSSASDSLSLTVVREFFPADVVRWLERARCTKSKLPDGTVIDLHMVSSMGNAFTFPLQTLFFSAIVYGSYRALDIPIQFPYGGRNGNFAVFGDDIIVKTKAYNFVCKMLKLAGFTVNIDKSFGDGDFRESCGLDYFSGYNIRGVYVQQLLDAGDVYSAINRLNRWSARHGIVLRNTIQFLLSKCRFLPVPYDESDDAGIKVPRHMLKVRGLSEYTGGISYRFRSVVPLSYKLPIVESEDEVETHPATQRLRRRTPKWFYNPPGILLSLLHGSIRNGSLTFRTDVRKAVNRTRYSSRWDYIPFDQYESIGFGESWKTLAWMNLEEQP